MKKFIIAMCVFVFLGNLAIAANSPVSLLESSANQLIAKLQQNKSQLHSNPRIIDNLVKEIILPHVDQMQMARSVVSRDVWLNANSAQQAQFLTEFRKLVTRTYAAAFAEYTNETVKFFPLRSGEWNQTVVQVQSSIIRGGRPPIPVSYSLTRAGAGWKVIDFSVEGVSMVQSFRSQFAGMDVKGLVGLTQRIQQHTK